MPELPAEVRNLLEGPNVAHLATLLPDGAPHSVAVWIGTRDDHVIFFTQEHSRKARNLQADPRVAISLVDRENPYATGWVRGRVVETLGGEAALELIDGLALKYTGEPFPMRSGTVFVIEAERAGSMTLPFRPVP
jgi:PPOX class probable F420-dependent enzyme